MFTKTVNNVILQEKYTMHILMDSLAFEIAKRDKGTYPMEVFGDDSKILWATEVTFISDDHCEIKGKDFLFSQKECEDNPNQIIIFLQITSSKRSSNIWPTRDTD